MKLVSLSVLLAAGVLAALPASAQEGGLPPPAPANDVMPPLTATMQVPDWDGDAWRRSGFEYETPLGLGLDALHLGKFNRAETAFAKVLKRDADNADANLYMGVARMNLGKWEDAKTNLEIALNGLPTHPDPKSRLGVTYAMLGDTAGPPGPTRRARAHGRDLQRHLQALVLHHRRHRHDRQGPRRVIAAGELRPALAATDPHLSAP